MRIGIGLSIFVIGCTSGSEHKLPSASVAPHLDSPSNIACGDDIAWGTNTAPDLRYVYAFDANGLVTGATGTYTAGGANDDVVYTYDNLGRMTGMTESRAPGDGQVQISAAYDSLGDLVTYTEAETAQGWSYNWTYAFSNFRADGMPTREDITGDGQTYGYTLAFDSDGRLVQAVDDTGETTTYTYDDVARTLAIDTNNGAFHGDIVYDDQDRELSETWGGTDANAWASQDTYNWDNDRLLSVVYESGTYDAPKTLSPAETDTLRYDCSQARRGFKGSRVGVAKGFHGLAKHR